MAPEAKLNLLLSASCFPGRLKRGWADENLSLIKLLYKIQSKFLNYLTCIGRQQCSIGAWVHSDEDRDRDIERKRLIVYFEELALRVREKKVTTISAFVASCQESNPIALPPCRISALAVKLCGPLFRTNTHPYKHMHTQTHTHPRTQTVTFIV